MMKRMLFTMFTLLFSMQISAAENRVSVASNHTVQETADRFEALIQKKGLTLFARIDHQANAASIDSSLRPTQLFIFGNPKVGTPVMQCSQVAAIDLPQKMLIWQDANGKVWLSYNSPDYIRTRHDIQGCDKVLMKISKVLSGLSAAVAANNE